MEFFRDIFHLDIWTLENDFNMEELIDLCYEQDS